MKNIYTKNEFLTNLKYDETLNENFIGKMFKGLWNSVMKLSNKVKGSKEINAVYDKYKKIIDDTFAKIGNVGAAETVAATTTKATTPVPAPVTAQPVVKQNTNFNYVGDKLNEADAIANPATTSPVETADQKKQNTTQQKNLINLTPEKIAKVAKMTEDRITQLKTQFENEVNAIIKRLSKNPDYSSDKLTAYSNVMKNQFNTYVFDQWWGIYQKAGDQKKLTELTKTKKENELKFKQSVDALNTKIGEKSAQVTIATGNIYKYDSTVQNKEIKIQVIGKALGQDENGNPGPNAEHKNMWKVKTNKSEFWVAPTAFKSQVTVPPTTITPKVGEVYSYDSKIGKVDATIVKLPGEDNGNPPKGKQIIAAGSVGITYPGLTVPTGQASVVIDISNLKKK